MIDWITLVVPCRHPKLINDGAFQRIKAGGDVEWISHKRLQVKGSFDSAVSVRSATWVGDWCEDGNGASHIEISGNLAKFFQGHNLWGTDDLHGLVWEFLRWLTNRDLHCESRMVTPTESDIAAWRAGDYSLSRVDVTNSFHLPTRADVLTWLRAAESTAHLSHRGRGQLVKGSTLYFGQHSRRWSLKLYAKGQEIEAVGHGQESILRLPSALAWADRSLRAELVLRGMELRRRGLATGLAWRVLHDEAVDCSVSAAMLQPILGAMTMTTTGELPADVFDSLTPSQRLAFLAWQAGHDLRSTLSNGSFYRLRGKLLPHGVDIATLQPKEATNVIPLVRFLEAVPAPIPDWAEGTALYFQPRAIRAA